MSSEKDREEEFFNLQFHVPSSFILAGSSSCGKTTWVLNVLRHGRQMFRDPRVMDHVYYFYNIWQEAFDIFDKEGIVTEWINEVPTRESITELTERHKKTGGSVVVIDDYANSLPKESVELFTIMAHHLRLCIFLQSQSLFPNNVAYRELSLNANYLIVFKTSRDLEQVRRLARQLAPTNFLTVVKIYEDETENQFSYLLVDLHHSTPKLLKYRSNVLPSDGPMAIYRPRGGRIEKRRTKRKK
jgi:SpoVK/Ycf46/Vps4 family AAA+-type ATPase